MPKADFFNRRTLHRENAGHPTNSFKTMLQEILYGTFVPPEATSRTHRIGLSDGKRYTPPLVREYNKNEAIKKDPTKLVGSKAIIFKVLQNQVKPVPASVVEKKTKYTRNHCSIIMADLFKLGLLTRTKIHANGTRLYLYEVKRDSKAV